MFEERLENFISNANRLVSEFKMARFRIDKHVSAVRSRIDLHAEKLIHEIHEKRIQLLYECDRYQESLLSGLDSRIDETKVESLLKQAVKISDSSQNSELKLNLIEKNFDILKEEETIFEKSIFDGNYIDFEAIENVSNKLLGSLYLKPVRNANVQEFQTTQYRMLRFDMSSLSRFPKHETLLDEKPSYHCSFAGLSPLKRDSFLVHEIYSSSNARISIISNDFRHMLVSKYFVNFAVFKGAPEEYRISVLASSTCRIAMCHHNSFQRALIHVFDENLNLLTAKEFDPPFVKLTANEAHIFMLTNASSHLYVYDFELNFLRTFEIAFGKVAYLRADEANRLMVRDAESEDDSIVVFELNEQAQVVRELNRVTVSFLNYPSDTLTWLSGDCWAHWDVRYQKLTVCNMRTKKAREIEAPVKRWPYGVEICKMASFGCRKKASDSHLVVFSRDGRILVEYNDSILI
jgi:hypothetical protein